MVWPPLPSNLISCYSHLNSPCFSHTDLLALLPMHQGDLGSNCSLCLENSSPNIHWTVSHTTFQEFCSALTRASPCILFTATIPPPAPLSPHIRIPIFPILYFYYMVDNWLCLLIIYYQSPSTKSLTPWRNKLLSFLFTHVSQIFRKVVLNKIC